MSYPSHCPTCRHRLAGLRRRYCGWGLATIDRCHACGDWVLDPDGIDELEHDAIPAPLDEMTKHADANNVTPPRFACLRSNVVSVPYMNDGTEGDI